MNSPSRRAGPTSPATAAVRGRAPRSRRARCCVPPHASIATTQGRTVGEMLEELRAPQLQVHDLAGLPINPVQLEHAPCRIHTDHGSVSLHLGPSGLPAKSLLFPSGTSMPSAREGPTLPSCPPASKGVGGVHPISAVVRDPLSEHRYIDKLYIDTSPEAAASLNEQAADRIAEQEHLVGPSNSFVPLFIGKQIDGRHSRESARGQPNFRLKVAVRKTTEMPSVAACHAALHRCMPVALAL